MSIFTRSTSRRLLAWTTLVVASSMMVLPLSACTIGNGTQSAAHTAVPSATVTAPSSPTATVAPTPSAFVLDAKVCGGAGCLSAKAWAAAIDSGIHQRAVGYAYLILMHGQVVVQQYFGIARRVTDAAHLQPLAFTSAVPINIASVTKTLTAVAALKLLAAKHISLDAPIYPYLPKSWTLGPNIRSITFRELMQHRSGIRSTNDLGTGYDDLRTLIARGIRLSDKVYHYQNHNFALFRILIPYLNGFSDTSMSDSDIGSATAQQYLAYMNSVYGQYFTITCTPWDSALSLPSALAYSYPADQHPGKDWGDWTAICGGGGLQLSANDLGQFLKALNIGAFISTSQVQQMYANLLGWDYLFTTRSHGPCYAKNGFLTWNNGAYITNITTLIAYCPSLGLGFVGVANSRLGTATTAQFGFPGSWDDVVQRAYTSAWR